MSPGFPVETKKSKVIFVIADKMALSHYTIISMHIVFIIDKYAKQYFIVPTFSPEEQVRKQCCDAKYKHRNIETISDIITRTICDTSRIMNCEIGAR